jgi:hypothetical protein
VKRFQNDLRFRWFFQVTMVIGKHTILFELVQLTNLQGGKSSQWVLNDVTSWYSFTPSLLGSHSLRTSTIRQRLHKLWFLDAPTDFVNSHQWSYNSSCTLANRKPTDSSRIRSHCGWLGTDTESTWVWKILASCWSIHVRQSGLLRLVCKEALSNHSSDGLC